MPAPLVIPVVETMATATCYAEKANRVSENKFKITVGILDTQQSDLLVKMDKELFTLNHELAIMKHKRRAKRSAKKEADRGSPLAKLICAVSCESPISDNSENIEPKRRYPKGSTMAERNDNERINNLQRRYAAQQLLTRSGLFLDVKESQKKLKPRIL